MKRLVLLVAIGSLAIGAAACEDTQETQSRSSVCADPEPVLHGEGPIQFVSVGDVDNPDDILPSLGSIAGAAGDDSASCVEIGKVDYDYLISKYETTNAQYAEFLNSQASECVDVEVCTGAQGSEVCTTELQSDVHVLYPALFPSIARTGEECSIDDPYVYTVKPGLENRPVQGINFFMATRFANWYENGKPAFIAPMPTNDITPCTQALQKVFVEVPFTGCPAKPGTKPNGKPINLPYENISTTTNNSGSGLTLDIFFSGGAAPYSPGNRMFKIRVNNLGSGYQVGDTVTVARGEIFYTKGKPGSEKNFPCNNEATITLNESHFRTSADGTTEAGSATVCPSFDFINRDTSTGAVVISTITYEQDVEDRSSEARFFVPSGDEWHKAAYYDPATASYSDFPTKSNDEPTCACPGTAGDAANCDSVLGSLSDVGAYPEAESWYGTFDQAGNVTEWTDYRSINCDLYRPQSSRLYRGAAYLFDDRPNLNYAQSISAYDYCLDFGRVTSGFRMAKCTGPAPFNCQPDGPAGPVDCPP